MDPMSEKFDLYDFKMSLFENGNPEEFLLFVCNFQMTLKASVTLTASADIHYICTLLRCKALHQLDTLSVKVRRTFLYIHKSLILVFPCRLSNNIHIRKPWNT